MQTYTSRTFDPVSPTTSMISIVDIAHGLSMQARFSGQLIAFYSVAEHCVMVSCILESMGYPRLALAGLLHDGHEAYTSDIPSPVKAMLQPKINQVEKSIDTAIFKKFDLEYPSSEDKVLIKFADQMAFYIEDRDLRNKVFPDFDYSQLPSNFQAIPVGLVQAKIQFLERFIELLDKAKE